MIAETSRSRKPRRKWGWFLVVLLFLQAALFFYLYRKASIEHAHVDAAFSAYHQSSLLDKAVKLAEWMDLLLIIFGATSLLCIGLAVIGLWRRS